MGRTRIRVAFCGIALALAAAMALSLPGFASAQLVRSEQLNAMIASNPLPGNDFALLPEWKSTRKTGQFGLEIIWEQRFTQNLWFKAATTWTQEWKRRGPDKSGVTNVTLQPIYRFYESREHSFALGAGIGGIIGTGGPGSVATPDWPGIGPLLLGIKGFGDLPDSGWWPYFQPFLIQGDMDYVFGFSRDRQRPAANVAISYSFRYLRKYTAAFDNAPQFLNIIPFVEFNYLQEVGDRQVETRPDFRILPGLAYLAKGYQLAVGVQLPLNNRAYRRDRAAVLVGLDLFYRKLVPAFPNTLF